MRKFICSLMLLLTVTLGMTAAGTVTQSFTRYSESVSVVTLTWTGDTGNGTVPSTALTQAMLDKVNGYFLQAVVTNPGSPTPTDQYDLTLTNAAGLDIMDGNIANRSNVTTEVAYPVTSSFPVDGALTINFSNNSDVSAVGEIKLYFSKVPTSGIASLSTGDITINTAGLSTSANQTAGTQKTQVVTSGGTTIDTFGGGTQYATGDNKGSSTGTLAMISDGTLIRAVSGTVGGLMKVDISGTASNTTPVQVQSNSANLATATLQGAGLPAALGTGGGVKIDGSGTALPVSAASLPLPSGAATATLQGGGLPAALGAGGGVKIDGSGTAVPVSGTVTVNAGTNLNTSALATEASLAKATIAQGASLGSNTQAMVGGSVTTASPTYTNGQISPLNLTTKGGTRVQVIQSDGTAVDTFGGGAQFLTGADIGTGTGTIALGSTTTSAPTYTTAKVNPLSLDTAGNLRVNVAAGSAANAAASATGSAVPAAADYAGVNVGGNLRGQTAVNPTGSVYAAQTDLSSIAGTVADGNSGNKSAGTLRVVLATDQPQLTAKLLVTPDANSTVDLNRIAGTTTSTSNGTVDAGTQRVAVASNNTPFPIKIDQTTPGTTNLVAANAYVAGAANSLTNGVFVTPTTANSPFAVTGTVTAVTTITNPVKTGDGTGTANDATHPIFMRPVTSTGVVADDSAVGAALNSGETPVYVGGVYESSPATLTTGQKGSLHFTAGQNLKIDFATSAANTTAGLFSVKVDQTTPGTTDAFSLARLGANAVAVGNGVSSTGALRVALASDNTAISTTGFMSVKFDQSTPGTTNGVSLAQLAGGTVNTGNGTSGTGTLRVAVASDNTAFNVTSNSANIATQTTAAAILAKQPAFGTAGTDSADVLTVQGRTGMTPVFVTGSIADGAADSNNPIKIGGKAVSTAPAVVDADDRVNATFTLTGGQLVNVGSVPQDRWQNNNAATALESATAVSIVTGTSARYTVLSNLMVTNNDATVGAIVRVIAGTGTYCATNPVTLWTGWAAPLGGGFAIANPEGIASATVAADDVCLISSDATASILWSASGFKSALKRVP
jgi:hypothetical protein